MILSMLLMLSAQAPAAPRYEPPYVGGLRFVGLLLIVLLGLVIAYVIKRLMK